MLVSRAVFSLATLGTKSVLKQLVNNTNAKTSLPLVTAAQSCYSARFYTVNHLSKCLELITLDKDVKLVKDSSTVKVAHASKKPLVIMLPWLMAKPEHVLKYANFYIDQGFDVLTVRVSPWQMLWPVKGSQVVADELVSFLHHNYCYNPMMIHGFSVGGYLWGEVCVRFNEQAELYKPIVDRIVGQVWDSLTEISELTIGLSRAVFPDNKVMQNVTNKYIRYHLRTFHEVATIHYIRSSQMFHTNIVKAPTLFFLSKTDPVGTEESITRLRDNWVANGVQTYWKCWDKSPHVGHFRKHPQEYAAELHSFLNTLSLLQYPEKIRIKM